jgi:hypothetical protein
MQVMAEVLALCSGVEFMGSLVTYIIINGNALDFHGSC